MMPSFICKALRLDFYDLIGLENDDENLLLSEYAGMPRNQIISKARERVGMSREQLRDRIGGTFEQTDIIDMEENPNYLDTWSIDVVIDLAEALKVPPQLLLGKV